MKQELIFLLFTSSTSNMKWLVSLLAFAAVQVSYVSYDANNLEVNLISRNFFPT
jgi:hypothetical protein